jgi:hypothetical protein
MNGQPNWYEIAQQFCPGLKVAKAERANGL